MKVRLLIVLMLFAASGMCFAKANYGAWLKKVSQADHERMNPYAGQPHAIAAGRLLFLDHCAKCHGEDAEGKGSRPTLRGLLIQHATDGDLAWILKNGQVFRGMPSWAGLPEQERWQLVAYIRSLNNAATEETR